MCSVKQPLRDSAEFSELGTQRCDLVLSLVPMGGARPVVPLLRSLLSTFCAQTHLAIQ